MYKDDVAYVSMRLKGTVVVDKRIDQLMYVQEVTMKVNSLYITALNLAEGNSYGVEIDNLELSSPPLGNIVFKGHVYYVSRQPKREDWRQGIRKENLSVTKRGVTHNWNLPTLSLLYNAVFNNYPSYKKCISLIDSGYSKEEAFGRIFSLGKDKEIWYKQRMRVGKDKDGVPILKKKFSWLQEALDDELKN